MEENARDEDAIEFRKASGVMKVEGATEMVSPSIVRDGPCLKATLENLRRGVGGKPMSNATLSSARHQALDFLQEIVRHYSSDVAVGEVGEGGTGAASSARPIVGRCPTGLLYGRVQSGKTLAMIALTSAAFDNGFKLVLVFTSNYLELVKQTRRRFQAVDGRKIFDSTRPEDWSAETDHISRQLARSGVVVVCAKDPTHTKALVDLLERTSASKYPALIFDDEADQATPDTTTAARARGGTNAPLRGSAIFRRIVLNDDQDEFGHSVREKLRHNVFVQVTATPYALILQRTEHPLRPKFTLLVEPGDGYTGGESFFSAGHVGDSRGQPPLIFVPTTEQVELATDSPSPPQGLTRAVCFFVVSAAAQQLTDAQVAVEGQNFLCHTSVKKGEHDRLGDMIRKFVDQIGTDLLGGLHPGTTKTSLLWAYDELRRTLPDVRPFDEIVTWLTAHLHLRTFYVVNSDRSDAAFSSGLNFIVGGNILGRGLTIDNLLVTYYLRSAKVTQMDTMLQHARMFGYRRKLMPFTRVFVPETLAVRFHHIHESEQNLRQQFRETPDPLIPTIQTVANLRPTRLNVLDGASIGTFEPGQHLYPFVPVYRRAELGESEKRIRKILARLLGKEELDARFIEIDIADAKSLIKAVPVSEADEDRWDPKAIFSVLDSISDQCQGKAFLYLRSIRRKSEEHKLLTGAVSDDELTNAKARSRPVLFMFHENGQGRTWDSVPFFYPSLVFPSTMKDHVFNVS
jgi:hypothetical protein